MMTLALHRGAQPWSKDDVCVENMKTTAAVVVVNIIIEEEKR